MRIGLVAGEASGDVLGAGLIAAIKARCPDAVFEGVAGPLMIAAGCRSLASSERLAVMGLVEVLARLPDLFRLRRELVAYFSANPPDVFIGIDAPDFNLGLELRLRKHGIKTVHYVSPSVWAWRQSRVKYIARCVDLLLTLLPFEAAFYRDHGVAVSFVGHTLADQIPLEPVSSSAQRTIFNLPQGVPVVAILPGSRMSEVTRLGPIFIATMAWLKARTPEIVFVAPMATPRIRDHFAEMLKNTSLGVDVHLVDGRAREVMQAADVVLVASGTATLEAMLVKRPMVMAYKLNALTYWLVRLFNLVKIRSFALPNLLAGEQLVPEFIQHDATPERLGGALLHLLHDEVRAGQIRQRFYALHEMLRCNASARAAEAILALCASKAE